MTAHQHNYYFYAGIIALAIVSFLWSELLKHTTNNVSRVAPMHSADYFSVGYQKWQMDEKGERALHINANKMTHYSDNKTILLEHPEMIIENEANIAPWHIQAKTGEITADTHLLLLNGQVFIERAASAKAREIMIETADVTVTPLTHFAQTTQRTQLRSGKNITTGLGMKTTFNAPIHLELLAKVHSHYETK